jgi:non-specific serine/threonine protein kinase
MSSHIEEWEILDLLTVLVNKSLVIYEEDENGVGRYRLLETTRQYAYERLLESTETEAVRRRHRDFFLRLAEETGVDQFETEHDNLRAALEWCLAEESGAESGLRLATALAWFWITHGYNAEGREWMMKALDRSGDVPAALRAQTLCLVGRMTYNQDDYTAARLLYEESLTLFQKLGDKRGLASVLKELGFLAFAQGDYEQAQTLNAAALASYRGLEDKWGIAGALFHLGHVARMQDNYAAARSYYEEALALNQEVGNEDGIPWVLCDLGHVGRSQGDYNTARLHYREALVMFQKQGNKLGFAYSLEGFASLAAAQGHAERAVRLRGAAEALREAIGVPLPAVDRAQYDHYVETARAALGEKTFAAAWAEGRKMTMEEAVAYALNS